AVYGVEQAFGLCGLVIAKCVLVSGGALLLYKAIDRAARPLFVVWLGAALLCARHLLLVRPVIVSLVLLALFFAVLERHRRRGRTGALFALPLAQCLWSNCQGLFALGPALVLAYAAPQVWNAVRTRRAWRDARALAATALACIVAALVTPFGFSALALPARL